MTTVAVIDFETTGLSPAAGDRATEIAIVLLEGDRVVDRLPEPDERGRADLRLHRGLHRHQQRDDRHRAARRNG